MKKYYEEFEEVILNLKNNELVQELEQYSQHLNTSRLEHSLSVAYITYKTLKRFNLDQERINNATYAALLHDLFLYDWRAKNESSKMHAFMHPVRALENAKRIISINDVQENIILSHMFPLCKTMPKSLEAWVVQYADKVSATQEYVSQYYRITRNSRVVSYFCALVLLIKN